jgi:hypothetical protein
VDDGTVFLVGAGASWAAPANLPLFSEIQGAIAKSLRVDSALLSRLAPEATMMTLHNAGFPVEEDLVAILHRGLPNLIHHVLAEALERGAVVWTPNIDVLIEAAARWNDEFVRERVAAWVGETAPPGNIEQARLLKPHGSVTTSPLKLRSDQVLVPLEGAWRDRLLRDFGERKPSVVVYGYAGRDTDLRPVLQEAFQASGPVLWFEPEATARVEIGDVYGPYCIEGLRLLPSREGELLHAEFLQWAEEEHLLARVPSRLRASFERAERAAPSLKFHYGNRPLVRAQVLSSVGSARDARRAFNGTILGAALRGRRAEALDGMKARAKFAYWHDERKLRWIGWLLGSRVARRIGRLRAIAYDRHVVVLMNRGRVVEAARLAREAAGHRGLLLDRLNDVAANRWLTRLEDVEDQARLALADARNEMERSGFAHRDVQTTARAAFEVALTAFWKRSSSSGD